MSLTNSWLIGTILVLLPLGITFGKYVSEKIKNFLLSANNFFFNSDKLVENGMTYSINNWGGTSNIEIQFATVDFAYSSYDSSSVSAYKELCNAVINAQEIIQMFIRILDDTF